MFTAKGYDVLDGAGNAIADIVYDSTNKCFVVYDDEFYENPEGVGDTEDAAIKDWMYRNHVLSIHSQPNPNQGILQF